VSSFTTVQGVGDETLPYKHEVQQSKDNMPTFQRARVNDVKVIKLPMQNSKAAIVEGVHHLPVKNLSYRSEPRQKEDNML